MLCIRVSCRCEALKLRYVSIPSSYILVLSFVIRFEGMNGARKPWRTERRAFTGMLDECTRKKKPSRKNKNEIPTTTTAEPQHKTINLIEWARSIHPLAIHRSFFFVRCYCCCFVFYLFPCIIKRDPTIEREKEKEENVCYVMCLHDGHSIFGPSIFFIIINAICHFVRS